MMPRRQWRLRSQSDASRRLDSNGPTPPGTLIELFLGFLSIGARSFGGVLPAAYHVIVEQRRWLPPADFTETFALCQILPGPNVGNAAIVLGKRWSGSAARSSRSLASSLCRICGSSRWRFSIRTGPHGRS